MSKKIVYINVAEEKKLVVINFYFVYFIILQLGNGKYHLRVVVVRMFNKNIKCFIEIRSSE